MLEAFLGFEVGWLLAQHHDTSAWITLGLCLVVLLGMGDIAEDMRGLTEFWRKTLAEEDEYEERLKQGLPTN